MTEPERNGLICITFDEPTRWERLVDVVRRYLRVASWVTVCNLLALATAILAAHDRWPWAALTAALYTAAIGFAGDAISRHRRRTWPGEGVVRRLPDPHLDDALRRAVDRMARDVAKRWDGGSK